MKHEHTYRWRIRWCGRMTTTRHHCTEEHIRKEHPEAVRVEGSLVITNIPETEAERRQRSYEVDTAYIGRGPLPEFYSAPHTPEPEKEKGPEGP